jgi:hypothetical protein
MGDTDMAATQTATLPKPNRFILTGGFTSRTVKTSEARIYGSATYLSNGHWLIRKDRLSPKALDAIGKAVVIRPMPEESMAKVVPGHDVAAWTVGDVESMSGGRRIRKLYSETLAAFSAIQVEYAEWLGLTTGSTVYGKSEHRSFRTAAGDVFMSVRY